MIIFLICVMAWYLTVFLLIYINYKIITKDAIDRANKIAEIQIKAHKAAFDWQRRQYFLGA